MLRAIQHEWGITYDEVYENMPCAQFETLCWQLVEQSYTKSELLVSMRLLESNTFKHRRKIYKQYKLNTNCCESLS